MATWLDTRCRLTAGIVFFLAVWFACADALAIESKHVLVLHSFGRETRPWTDYAQSIRAELERQSPWPLEITDQSLVSARSDDEGSEGPFVEYLGALFAKHPLDLIVAVGGPAASFVQRHRGQLFATTPMILTAVEQRRVQYSILTANDAVVPLRIDFFADIQNILQVLPDTKDIAVVVGTSPIEQFWREEIRKDVMPFADRVSFTFYDDLSFSDILKHAAALPPHSAIFWELMIVDAAGAVHEGDTAFEQLHAAADAPIFAHFESNIGQGLVGGPYNAALDSSRRTAAVAVRILGGEKPSDITTSPLEYAPPKFDWREMQRWGISESNLPAGSEILFREPSAWEQYKLQILSITAAILAQALLIAWLLHERQYRHRAERTARETFSELTQMNRIATAGELSAAIAHEVKQPITGIVTMANAALRWLSGENPDIGRAREAMSKVVAAGHHASDVITNVRGLFRKDTQEKVPTDINKLIRTVLGLVYMDLRKHSIESEVNLSEQLPPVVGNEVQLQQVILNLVMNAIESMNSAESRVLSIKSEITEHNGVRVSIADTGSGISLANLNHIFKPMFTTKARGMGMGLSICKSIIESHNGRIWVTAGAPKGSIFQFELPTGGTEH